jgi:uracil phosphoribosyltransferase
MNKIKIISLIVIGLIGASHSVQAKKMQEENPFPTLHIVNHPLVDHKLSIMRKKDTGTFAFGQLLKEIALLIGYEITRSLETKDVTIETPVAPTVGRMIDENEIVIVPILRAGLGMAEGLHQLIPTARQGHIGLYRDPKTKQPVEYLFKMPKINDQIFIVVDPMLATGNSAAYAVNKLIAAGVKPEKILFMALVVAPEGMKTFQKAHPTIHVFAASLDEKLNDHSYIVPGLGDAGDRLFGTK